MIWDLEFYPPCLPASHPPGSIRASPDRSVDAHARNHYGLDFRIFVGVPRAMTQRDACSVVFRDLFWNHIVHHPSIHPSELQARGIVFGFRF